MVVNVPLVLMIVWVPPNLVRGILQLKESLSHQLRIRHSMFLTSRMKSNRGYRYAEVTWKTVSETAKYPCENSPWGPILSTSYTGLLKIHVHDEVELLSSTGNWCSTIVLDLNLHHFVESAEIRGRIRLFTDWNLLLQWRESSVYRWVLFFVAYCLSSFFLFVTSQETEHAAYGWEKASALNWTSSLLRVFLFRADHVENTSSLTLCACLQKILETELPICVQQEWSVTNRVKFWF